MAAQEGYENKGILVPEWDRRNRDFRERDLASKKGPNREERKHDGSDGHADFGDISND